MATTFRLATVLKLRERERDAAAMAVQEVYRALQILDERSRELQAEHLEIDRQRQSQLQGAIAVRRLLDGQRYQMVLLGQLQHIAQQQEQLQEEKERREAVLVKRQQEVKVLEKLREKHQEEERKILEARQQSRIDEWSTVRSARNSQNT